MVHFYLEILKNNLRLEAGTGNVPMTCYESYTFQTHSYFKEVHHMSKEDRKFAAKQRAMDLAYEDIIILRTQELSAMVAFICASCDEKLIQLTKTVLRSFIDEIEENQTASEARSATISKNE